MTVAGMAHFAGTGPAGTTCRDCAHWRRDKEGWLRKTDRHAHCNKRLPGKGTQLVPGQTPSCRHFERLGGAR